MTRYAVWGTCIVLLAATPSPTVGQQEGVRLDFQDVELSLVLSALADAGNFNVVYSDLPARRVTLRMNQPVPRDQILPLLRSIATSNGLEVIEDGTLLRIEAVGPGRLGADQVSEQEAQPETDLRLFVHRLKHARAPRLAATLQAMFGNGPLSGGFAAPVRETLSEQLRGQRIEPTVQDPPEVVVQLGDEPQVGIPGQVLGEVLIVPDEPTNSLLVRAQPADWEVLLQAIEALDLRPLQVLIEVTIAEVRRTSDFSVGVTGTVSREGETGTTVGGSLGGITTGTLALELMRIGGVNVEAMLSILSSNGNVNILSRPVVLAQNNQEARILIGAQRPFIQVFRTLPTDAAVRDQVVQYRDVGTALTITPTINDDGYVNLQVIQEVSTATAEEQFGAPIISTREATTQLFVRSGQTVMMGGLIEQQQETTKSGVPLLKDIPVLGWLFGSTLETSFQSELFIFLTPHIIETDDDAEKLRLRFEDESSLLKHLRQIRPDTTVGRN